MIVVPVIDLEFPGSDVFEAQLLEGVLETPKARRIERRQEFLKSAEVWQKTRKTGGT